MSAEISPETVKAFEKYDKDGSGSIDKAELEAVLAEMGYPCEPSTIDSLLANFSTVGTLNLEQFDGVTRMLHLARKMELSKAPLDPKAQAAFNRLDTDGSGDISCAELHVLLRELEMDLDLDYARRLVHHYKNWPVGAQSRMTRPSPSEFTALYNDLSAGTTTVTPDVEPDILRCFREFDADANGEIDLHELGDDPREHGAVDPRLKPHRELFAGNFGAQCVSIAGRRAVHSACGETDPSAGNPRGASGR